MKRMPYSQTFMIVIPTCALGLAILLFAAVVKWPDLLRPFNEPNGEIKQLDLLLVIAALSASTVCNALAWCVMFNLMKLRELNRHCHLVSRINADLSTTLRIKTERIHAITVLLKCSEQKIQQYAEFNAHKLRGPIATQMGLIALIKGANFTSTNDHAITEMITLLDQQSHQLDTVVRAMQRMIDS